jgi:ribosomal protein S18 acetylase RimI-like enzyme
MQRAAKNPTVTIRDAGPMDRAQLRQAIVELQEYERRLHDTRLPGEQIVEAYLASIENQIGKGGAMLIAEIEHRFAGFVAGWIEQANSIAETPASNRFRYISDICVMPEFRGQKIGPRLVSAIESRLTRAGITRIRICSLAANASARATSVFGDALLPPAGAPAAWVTEEITPIPRNIYGVTKVARVRHLNDKTKPDHWRAA